MNYEREYATLTGLVDRALTILEDRADPGAPTRAHQLLLDALLDAERRYVLTEEG